MKDSLFYVRYYLCCLLLIPIVNVPLNVAPMRKIRIQLLPLCVISSTRSLSQLFGDAFSQRSCLVTIIIAL